MSYILEALKKSDQQRQQGAAPSLTSIQLPVEETRQRTFPWLVALAAMVFIAGILIGWLQPWKSEPPAATVQPVAEKPAVQAPAANPPRTAPVPLNAAADNGAALARNQGQIQLPQPSPAPPPLAALPAPVQTRQMPAKPIMPSVARDASPAAAAKAPVAALREPGPAAVKSAAIAEQNAMDKEDLPPAILQELPAMAVSLHAYSAKPGNRLVSINNQLLQEGDALAPGLTLEKITPKDMIFTYKGFRFRQGMR